MPINKNHLSNQLINDYDSDPYKQFDKWYQAATAIADFDPSPMVLATVDARGFPDTRIVLLKEYAAEGLFFYTHYNSPKGKQAEALGVVAVNFFWAPTGRQIRLKGTIKRIDRKKSEKYFASRPRASQLNTLASIQSADLENTTAFLKKVDQFTKQYAGQDIPCPETWGGYCIQPFEYEFFEAGNYRLNSRVRYSLQANRWVKTQLSP